jgi:glycosyltransferase involved in cell wall biosynthesis
MHVALYSPYLATLGGGEKYLYSIAEVLSLDHQVDIVTPALLEPDAIKARSIARFADIDLTRVNFISGPFTPSDSSWQRMSFTARYQLFFYVTDGSFFWSRARKNIAIIQSPDTLNLSGLRHSIKRFPWKTRLCYSQYVQKWLEKKWHLDTQILSPAINPQSYKVLPKENIILMVGRFSRNPHDKKHLPMLNVFKQLVSQKDLQDWKLVIMGGMTDSDQDYYSQLLDASHGFPIQIIPNAPFDQLIDIYARAKIFWHATGFKENLDKVPEKAEHFGITTLEAMASAVVPVVVNAGGQPEIVNSPKVGFVWNDLDELKSATLQLVTNEHLRETMSLATRQRSYDFDKKTFRKKLYEILH